MYCEVDPEDQRAEKAPALDRDDEMGEAKQGLNMLGCRGEMVEWLVDADVGIMLGVNEVRRAVRIFGK